ncbi:MAG: BRCT domain-containing protein [[Pasteurella] mairii]|nr:BRCT domain-containing protein [[Pasteurella] mairii]
MEDKQLYSFNYVRNRNKLIANLISIIDGITSDGIISPDEMLYLDTWLLEAQSLQCNVVFQQIRDIILDIQFDGQVTKAELEELKTNLLLIQKQLLDLPNIDLYSKESDIHLLSGLCKGLISDNHLSDQEIRYLNWWITKNAMLKNNYPGKELYQFIQHILSDGIITDEERLQLKQLLSDFTGCDIENGIVDGLSIGGSFFDPIDHLDLFGSVICLTGKFLLGNREKCTQLAQSQGAKVIKDWRADLNYLIVGTLNSRDWICQSFGRKIEKVKEYQSQGYPVKIISEEQWINLTKKQ